MASKPPARRQQRRPRPPAVLASDGEREHAAGLLREAAVEGRLTLAEFSDRVSRALAARTREELAAVTSDLPGAMPASSPYYHRPPVEWSLGLLSVTRREGPWRLAGRTSAFASLGTVVLDLRTAVIDSPVVVVEAVALLGNVDVIVPEGVQVELEGLAIMGTRAARLTSYEHRPGMPVVVVRAYAFLGSVVVRNNRGMFRETFDRLRARL